MLRVGIILDSFTCSAWTAKVIEDIQSSAFARIELVILTTPTAQSRSSLTSRLCDLWKFTAFRLYESWDYKRNKDGPDALAQTDVSSVLDRIPSISAQPGREASGDSIREDISDDIRSRDLDVVFYFGSRTLRGGILGAARYGVWSFHPGSGAQDVAGAPLFWEIYERNPITESRLLILTDSPTGGRVIYRSHAATDQTSLYRNRNLVYWKTAEFALRRLRDLDMRGIEYIRCLPTYCEATAATPNTCRSPNAFQMAHFMARYLFRSLQKRLASLQPGNRTEWYLAIRRRSADHRFDDPSSYNLMLSPDDRFYADPFLVERDGKTLLFFEDFRWPEGRAVISCCELDSGGKPGLPFEVLRRPYHLSYPFIFEDEGVTYMVPESRGNRTLELYRATNFPTTWVAEPVLFSDVNLVDATIQKINGKFWMFAGVSNGKYSNCDELCLFFADGFRGPWTPHPCNPLLSDVQRARPAGALFYDQGRLIRPSQDCGKAYGYALVFSEVITLSETEYEERVIGRIDPGLVEGSQANHTYNRTEQFEVVDRLFAAKIARRQRNN